MQRVKRHYTLVVHPKMIWGSTAAPVVLSGAVRCRRDARVALFINHFAFLETPGFCPLR